MNETNRMCHVDMMRGFLMLLVVMEHSSTHIFKTFDGFTEVHTYMVYIVQFMMPAFFFICGYVLYRPDLTLRKEEIKILLRKKIKSQLISPILFFLLYLFISRIALVDGLYEYHKEGYWFTFTLFFFYILFSVVGLLFNSVKLKPIFKNVFLLLSGIGLFYLAHLLCSFESIKNQTSLWGIFHWRYFIFMVLGYLTRQYRLLDKGRKTELICGISIILYLILNVFYKQIDNTHWSIAIMNLMLLGVFGTIIVYCFFSNYGEAIHSSRFGRSLQYIGQRTLGVYYINFLLLPVQLQYCTHFLVEYPMPLVELGLSFILAAINIIVCMIIYNVVYLCPPLGEFLFGKQYTPSRREAEN